MTYAMSTWFTTHGYAEVYPDLFIGAYPRDVADVEELHHLDIDEVLNLVQDSEYAPGERESLESAYASFGIEETRLTLVDFGHLPADRVEEAVGIVVGWLEDDLRVYLHCRAGWQRSAAIAAGAVAVFEGIHVRDALRYVQTRKPSADPLPHQRADLAAWWLHRQVRQQQQQPQAS
jgi:atypical dual specificity phosphatase